MDLGIAGRVALVMGAGGGLGRAAALGLLGEGVNVAAVGRHAAALESLRPPAGSGARVLPVVWDFGDSARAEAVADEVAARLGPVDILFGNTGGPPPTTALEPTLAQWEQQFRLLALPVFALARCLLPGMRERGWGRVIVTTSSGVVAPIPGLALSNALRSALLAWAKTLAREVAGSGVTVNVMIPGRIDTDRVRALDQARATREGKSVEAVAAASRATIPAGRYGRPEEFADVAVFLASDRAGYVTGSQVRVDGGLLPNV